MKTVEVSESALESLKAMVNLLQSEKDALLEALKISQMLLEKVTPYKNQKDLLFIATKMNKEIIAKCTQTQSICDWQEKMNG